MFTLLQPGVLSRLIIFLIVIIMMIYYYQAEGKVYHSEIVFRRLVAVLSKLVMLHCNSSSSICGFLSTLTFLLMPQFYILWPLIVSLPLLMPCNLSLPENTTAFIRVLKNAPSFSPLEPLASQLHYKRALKNSTHLAHVLLPLIEIVQVYKCCYSTPSFDSSCCQCLNVIIVISAPGCSHSYSHLTASLFCTACLNG
jgi:hypothetical protein